jgi:pimeloyl-ACP methyl ester carboxylesterase
MHLLAACVRRNLSLARAWCCRITPRSADRIVSLYPRSQKVLIRGGHCPHDDAPQEVNAQLLKWMASLN